MHSWQDFSYFVLSIYHVFNFLFPSRNGRSDIVLKVKDFFPLVFSFITHLSLVLLLEKTNLRSFSSHWEKCSSVGFHQIFFWGVGGMFMQDVSTHLQLEPVKSHGRVRAALCPSLGEARRLLPFWILLEFPILLVLPALPVEQWDVHPVVPIECELRVGYDGVFFLLVLLMLTGFVVWFFSFNNSTVNASNIEGCFNASIKLWESHISS